MGNKQKDSRKLMSEAKFYEGYGRYNELDNKYEQWSDSISRVMSMHREKYKREISQNKELEQLINEVHKGYEDKLFLGSQRALQFGGDQLLKNNTRLYNCAGGYCDRPSFFGGYFFLLLSGCGVGMSVQKHHISKLPHISKRNKSAKTYVVPDSIEGWSNTIDVLLSSYFDTEQVYPEYTGRKVYFDLSKIRPKGSFISGGFKAPGPEPLRRALDSIELLIERELNAGNNILKPIVVYDICMYIADAVLSGGVRRAATLCMFSKDDTDMIKAKTGNWFLENPQRGRSNNSVVLLRDSTTKEEFDSIIESVKDYGEPGFIWVDDLEFIYNPCCFTGDMKLLTKEGYKTFKELEGQDFEIINYRNEISKGKVWSNGVKEVIELNLSNKTKIRCTHDHVFMTTDGEQCQAKDLYRKRLMSHLNNPNKSSSLHVRLGYIQGDGGTGRINSVDHAGLEIHIGHKDEEIFSLFNIHPEADKTVYYTRGYNQKLIELGFDGSTLPKRVFPITYTSWSKTEKLDFLRGCYSANGSVIKKHRVSYKTTSKIFTLQLIKALEEFGLSPYYTTNKAKKIKFENGEYLCKESYDVNITRCKDLILFYEEIGFVQQYKVDDLVELVKLKSPKVLNIKPIGKEEVYDFNEPLTHWGVVNGVVAHNCEVGMMPITEDGRTGFLTCNLTEINGAKSVTREIFLEQCKLASILGTLQAGYTNFKYFKDVTKELVERDALIGVGITGMMNNPNIIFDEDIMREGAETVKYWNKKVAKIIGINVAARTTVVKPSGNSSVLLGCSSGIHGEHAPRYLRHVQLSKESEVAKLLLKTNPHMCQESVWNKERDIVVAFPIEPNKNSMFKKDLLGVKQLEYVRKAQRIWIEGGTNIDRCNHPKLRHNVSNTITVDNWEDVANYIYNNRGDLCGVALLSEKGDKAYPQAPFTEVLTHQEIVDKYGEIAMFTSALIEAGFNAFNRNLWMACDTALGRGEQLKDQTSDLLKRDFVRRFIKFSKNFKSPEDCANCLKDVYNLHRLWKIKQNMQDIDWVKELTKPKYTDIDTLGANGCSGGTCEIEF